MDFKEDEDHRLIRESIRKLCEGFPDDYWEQHDREGIFPDEFFQEMAVLLLIMAAFLILTIEKVN